MTGTSLQTGNVRGRRLPKLHTQLWLCVCDVTTVYSSITDLTFINASISKFSYQRHVLMMTTLATVLVY